MIKFKKENQTLTCIPEVDIIASNIPGLREALLSHLDGDQEWKELVFDCSRIETMDSIGINLIVNVFKKTDADQKTFRMEGCNESVLNVLKLFRLDEHFTLQPG
ncbi:MAG: STAS domain-containing protein [Proteobacteria bacterium]|nr:STAS domain-containing protein [Pseudomonadota bacterium]